MIHVFERFTSANDYAGGLAYISGFPNFHQADYGLGIVMGTHLLPSRTVSWQDVPRAQLNGVSRSNVPELFREVALWCGRNGLAGGFPNCHETDYGAGPVQGVLTFHPSAIVWRDVKRADLGDPKLDDVPAMMTAAHDYAVANGFLTAIPTFHQQDHGQGVVYGLNMIRPGYADWQDVFEDIFHIYLHFTYQAGISQAQRDRLRARHVFAYNRIRNCGTLTASQQASLIRAYQRNIDHRISTDARANARAPVGGSNIEVNFANLFPLGDIEIAQTLIHEMMHCAGFRHPDRRDEDPTNPGAPFDTPGDNGQYYGTPPLQAEICIAGAQSDMAACLGNTQQVATVPRIERVMFNPPGRDVSGEYVVIKNDASLPVDMTGWQLSDRARHTYKFPPFVCSAGAEVTVWTGTGTDDSRNLHWGRKIAVWNNDGDTALLARADGLVVSRYAYGTALR